MPRHTSGPIDDGAPSFPVPAPITGECMERVWRGVTYHVPDGQRPLELDLYVPEPGMRAAARAPLIVWLHGGGWLAGSRNRMARNLEPPWIIGRMVLAGFAVANVDYRLLSDARFPGPVDDVCEAVHFLSRNAKYFGIDRGRIAIAGESAGGHLALLAAGRLGHDVSAVVDWYGPTSLTQEATDGMAGTPGGPDPHPEEALPLGGLQVLSKALERGGWTVPEASPLEVVDEDFPPTFIAHGVRDSVVPIAHSRALAARLADCGVPHDFLETTGGHVFRANTEQIPDIVRQSLAFVAQHMHVELGPWLDPELDDYFRGRQGRPGPFDSADPAVNRARDVEQIQELPPHGWKIAREEEFELGSPAVRIRLLYPHGPARALVVHYHGGGWTIGGLESHRPQAERIAAQLPAIVVQVEYRLAPEHPFPAAYDDCLAAALWAADVREQLGVEKLVLSGDSAGGNLALAVGVALRDRGIRFDALHLNYPALDLRDTIDQKLVDDYLGGDRSLVEDPRVSPYLAKHRGLPPIVLGVGGRDELLDQCLEAFHEFKRARVPVTLRVFPSLPHAYFNYPAISQAADRAVDEGIRLIAEALWRPASE